MKQFIILLALCFAFTATAVFAADNADKAKSPPPATTQAATPINKFCAVDHENPVDSTVPTVTYKGKVIGFCCEDCIPKFKKNPERYMKDLK